MKYTQKKFLKSKLGQEIMVVTLEYHNVNNDDVIYGKLVGFDKNTITIADSEKPSDETLVYIKNIVRIK